MLIIIQGESPVKKFKILYTALASLVLLQACNDDDDINIIETPTPEPMMTIVETAVSAGTFNTLVAALEATDLDDTLSDTSQDFTVFAPTDDAFALLGQETIDALLADPETLADILTYHVYSGAVNEETAVSLAGTKVAMVNGDNVGLSLSEGSLLVNTVTVTSTDIIASNGIIHVLDAVLLPPAEMTEPTMNIVDTAVGNGGFTKLVEALQVTGLDAVLADEAGEFTVFAPTDAAFALIDEKTMNTLLANPETLKSILLQHVVSGISVDSITAFTLNGQSVETASETMQPIAINTMSDKLTFGGVNVTATDIYTTNGIIHVIDAVVVGDVEIPAYMSLVEVAVDNGNFTTLADALVSTGLDKVLGDLDKSYTVFAPTDDAFDKLPEGTLDNLTTEQLSDILLYHVLPGTVRSDAAISLAQSAENTATTAAESSIALSFVTPALFANGAKISSADVMATNGVIHVVDTVILPPSSVDESSNSIVDVAVADTDNFSTLVTALTAADLVTALADETKTYTVFAPTNAAFDKVDATALADLLADTTALTEVLLTHVVEDVAITAIDAYAANGMTLKTMSGNTIDVSVDADSGSLMIGGAKVTTTEIVTSNGIIHVIDTVILD
jgi:uncharacterized surface protein with fasciclin (FAS1) repeats